MKHWVCYYAMRDLLDFYRKTRLGLHIMNLDLNITNNRIIISHTYLHGLRKNHAHFERGEQHRNLQPSSSPADLRGK